MILPTKNEVQLSSLLRLIHRNILRVDSDIGFETACRNAKITDFRFHDLRHTFATNFLQRTSDIRALQEILGHSDIKMTEKYTHVVKEHLKKLM
jgi:site-specific recombinase XerD